MGMLEDFKKINVQMLCEQHPKDAAELIIALNGNTIMELCLCEHDKIIPMEGRFYRYRADDSCKSCLALKSTYEEEQ